MAEPYLDGGLVRAVQNALSRIGEKQGVVASAVPAVVSCL